MNIVINLAPDESQHSSVLDGEWRISGNRDGLDAIDITNMIEQRYGGIASLFHSDGRAIVNELPSEGTFLVIR